MAFRKKKRSENQSVSSKESGFINAYDAYKSYFELSDKKVIDDFANECQDFFIKNKKFHGYNKSGEACILGYELCHYKVGGAIFEPIIYNLDTGSYVTNYKELGLDKKAARYYQALYYDYERYKDLQNMLFVFADSEHYYQFNFHENHIFNDENKSVMIEVLKSSIF